MNKIDKVFHFLILTLTAAIVVSGCFGKEDTNPVEPTVIDGGAALAVGDGCCKTSDGCASGPTVTKDYCSDELNGTWNAGDQCNVDTGKCE